MFFRDAPHIDSKHNKIKNCTNRLIIVSKKKRKLYSKIGTFLKNSEVEGPKLWSHIYLDTMHLHLPPKYHVKIPPGHIQQYLSPIAFSNVDINCLAQILTDMALSDVYDSIINVISAHLPESVYVYKFQFDGNAGTLKDRIVQMMDEPLMG